MQDCYLCIALSQLLQNQIAAVGAGLNLPFLQYRQMQLDNVVSQVDYQRAVTGFRQTLYQALIDVENNLAGRSHYAEQAGRRERALSAAREAERIYRIRYEAGAVSLQSWLTAQETRRSAESTLAENGLDQILNYIDLAQSLGGNTRIGRPEKIFQPATANRTDFSPADSLQPQ